MPGAAPISCATCGTCTSSSRAKQDWARADGRAADRGPRRGPRRPRRAGKKALDPAARRQTWPDRYRAIAAAGLAANVYRRTATASDARRVARRFISREDMILRFITRPDLDIFTNNEAERTIRPVKVAAAQPQEAAGAPCSGLADFAVVQSYLSTATKWGIPKLDALRSLFNGQPLDATRTRTGANRITTRILNPRHSKPLTLAE